MLIIIISIIISVITSQIVFIINSKFYNKRLKQLQYDIVEACTDKVADYMKKHFIIKR